ncbi:MAG: acyl-CoA dehydrogenase [Oscillospiraceae bacterium]|nr:acyl-CoA dehydrogenase [Oscillospiraceae bacterium]
MDFKFTPEEQDIIDMLHDFCLKEVQPIAAEIDEEERFPEETVKQLAEMGMMGLPFPEEYGGAGLSYVTYIAACEELARYCASTSVTLSAHSSLCCWPISEYGTEEQKKKYLVPLASGEKLGAMGLTEPLAGTDAAMQKTTAVDKGDHWLINGTKMFITNAGYAETFVIFAMTDKEKGNKGISAFIIEKGFPGFSLGTKEKKMGIRASSTCELIFEDMIVPKENLLGELNKGFKIAMTLLDGGRIGIAAQALGIAEAAVEECIKYVTQRVQFGQTISKFQNTQFQLADMQTKVEASRLLIYRAAQAKQDHEPYSHLAAEAKLFASETASDVTRRCLQLIGGYGYTREYPFERFMRDAKITEIYEGTSEVQRMVISNYMGLR